MDRLVITSNGRDTVLADYTDIIREGVGIDMGNDFQVVKLFRGSTIVIYDRGNKSVTLNLVVVQEWNDDLRAFDWFTRARSLVPAQGDLAWTVRDRTGSFRRRMLDAAVQVKSLPRIGVTTFTQYTIQGGELIA